MPQNYSMPSNVTSFVDMLEWSNSTVGGMYGDVILLATWFVMFMVMKKFETKQAFTTASFTTALLGVFMFIFGIVTERALFIAIVLTAFSMLWLRWEKD